MAQSSKVPGTRKTRRSGADNKDPFTGIPARLNGPSLFNGEITQEAFNGMYCHRFIKIFSITACLAGMVTGSAVRAWERISVYEFAPGGFEISIPGMGQPALDILARRAGMIARRQVIDPDRMLAPDRADAFAGRVLKDACEILGYQAHAGVPVSETGNRDTRQFG